MAWSPKKKKGYIGLNNNYVPTDEEWEWYKYCTHSGVIIAPVTTSSNPYPEEWNIGVSFSNSYKKIHKTPTVYITDNVWPETFKLMKFYYDKRNE